MKKWLTVIMGILLACLFCGCTKTPSQDDTSSEQEDAKNTYNVTRN